ncbi:hypothetical protein [Exiguobacterium sp. S22-S28]|uniref:hypothetical protein n=1 Tax=Exiguobacterium sp. S22-S28 TaxID=3342768 RepID=UPI00372CF512
MADEPTGAFDEKTAADTIHLFQQLNRCVITVARAADHIIELKPQRFQMRTNVYLQTVSR